jgi:hypothetical protein
LKPSSASPLPIETPAGSPPASTTQMMYLVPR